MSTGELLENQLDSLRSVDTTESAQRVLQGIKLRTKWQRRQVIAASCGACVSAIGTIHFALQGDPFGYIALPLCTGVLAYTAWRSARSAARLGALRSGRSLLAGWRAELRRQLRHTLAAQLVAGLFVALTASVVWIHGILNWKTAAFLATAACVSTFAAYQYLVIRPSLQRELEVLDEDV
jgi:hypothetical protein